MMQVHDNYNKPLTGYYVNSACISAGKTLDKNMHEADVMEVADILSKLQVDLRRMQANLAGEEYKEPKRLNPITNPGSMAGLEADLNENTIQILLSDEWCRTIDSLQTGGGGD